MLNGREKNWERVAVLDGCLNIFSIKQYLFYFRVGRLDRLPWVGRWVGR